MLLASIFLTIGAPPQTIVTPSETLFCNQSLPHRQNDFRIYAEIETDKDYRPVASRLTVSARDLVIRWSRKPTARDVSKSPAILEVSTWPLPKSIAFPIVIELLVDGTSVRRFIFTKPNVTIVNPGNIPEAARLSQDFLSAASLGVNLPNIELTTFWNTTSLTLVAIDRHGIRADVKALALPNWKHLANFAATSFRALERNRIAKECRPVYNVLVID